MTETTADRITIKATEDADGYRESYPRTPRPRQRSRRKRIMGFLRGLIPNEENKRRWNRTRILMRLRTRWEHGNDPYYRPDRGDLIRAYAEDQARYIGQVGDTNFPMAAVSDDVPPLVQDKWTSK